MKITRREFSVGFLSLGLTRASALASSVDFSLSSKRPKIRFGVLADTHFRTSPGNGKVLDKNWGGEYFEKAITYFRQRNVDAVMHCGDFAHLGQVYELQAHADIWNKVFPSSEGAPAKLFVTGNHEFCSHIGGGNGKFVRRLYPNEQKWNDAVLQVDTAQKWKHIWNEEYEEVWHKEVLGFHFFGWQYGADVKKVAVLLEEGIKKYSLNKTKRPFFFIGHVPLWRPKELIKVLEKYKCGNSFAFYGNNHYSSANLNTFAINTGIFNSINVPCCAPSTGAVLLHDQKIASAPIEGRSEAQKPHSRQALVVSVYDDAMVIERHEFTDCGKIGKDLFIPLGKYAPHPFVRNELMKAEGAPEFRSGAELKVECKKVDAKGEIVRLSIPLAVGNPDSRVYIYDISIYGERQNDRLLKSIYASGCNQAMGRTLNNSITFLELPREELPKSKTLTFEVRPLSSLGCAGKVLALRCRQL